MIRERVDAGILRECGVGFEAGLRAGVVGGLTWFLLRQNDAAGMVALQGEKAEPVFVRPSQRSSQFGLMLRQMELLAPSGNASLASLLDHAARLVHRRSIILFFSDLLEPSAEIAQGFKRLRFNGHECLVFHVLDRDELEFPFTEPKVFEALRWRWRVVTWRRGAIYDRRVSTRSWRSTGNCSAAWRYRIA